MNQTHHGKKSNRTGLSDRERTLRDRKEAGGIAPKRLTPLEMDLTERLKTEQDRVLKLEQELDAYKGAEEARVQELQELRDTVKTKEREIQSERDRLAHEKKVIEAERRDNVKFRGDAVRLRKEIDITYKTAFQKQKELIEKADKKRRHEVNKHLETKAELEQTKSKLSEAVEEYRGMKDATDPRNIDVASMTKEDVEELRKRLTKHVKALNGNGNGGK